MRSSDLSRMIDHTMLRQQATKDQIACICNEAVEHHFATVAIHPRFVSLAHDIVRGTPVGITVAVAYPQGAWTIDAKCREIGELIACGATDCDHVVDIKAVRDGNYSALEREARACREAAEGVVVKAILEVCLLTEEEIDAASRIFAGYGYDYVKTSTGYLAPPTARQISVMAQAVAGTDTRVKAAGGITSLAEAMEAIGAGAVRLGTSSGVRIIEEAYARWGR